MLFDMNILHLSDTHGAHRSLGSLPEADVIVHSGDISMNGSSSEALDFMRWFSALPYAHKIFVAGNHDACLYGAVIDGLDPNCHYLCNSSVEIDGVTFYGVSMFMEDCSSGRQKEFYEMIPDGVDVLITHAEMSMIISLLSYSANYSMLITLVYIHTFVK